MDPLMNETLETELNTQGALLQTIRLQREEIARLQGGCGYPGGLTKRELFAALAMQGGLGALSCECVDSLNLSKLCKDAVITADALLAALAEPTRPTKVGS